MAEIAFLLGTELMGWQQLAADRGLEMEGSRPAHREVNLSIDRQAGKSTLVLATALRRMLATKRPRWVTYTTASRLAGRRKLLKTWWPLIQASPLASRFTVKMGSGSEMLECTANGSLLLLLSGDEASGHGDSIDLAILDEAWSLTDTAEQAVRPAMAARADAQLWVISTAGTAKSAYWRAKVNAGRTAAELGVTDGGVCFIEWAAGPDVDVTDETTWSGFMPALDRTISRDTVRSDLASWPLPEWRRGYANQWPDESDEGWSVIPQDLWEASRL